MPEFDIRKSNEAETRFVIAVNLIAPIEITKQILPNLTQSTNPRAIYIGSLSGLENTPGEEVANTASKFGLRGAAQALRAALKEDRIGFTVINPGNVATEEVLDDIEAGRFEAQTPIPMADLIATVEWLLNLSPDVEVGDIALIQKGRLA